MLKTMLMPPMGESIMEAKVLNWLKNIGDLVAIEDSIVEVATDKVDTEVPATIAGILKEILVQKDEIAEIGKPLCILEISDDHPNKAIEKDEELIAIQSLENQVWNIPIETNIQAPALSINKRFYSPLVLNIAKQEGVSLANLDTITGTGLEERVTKHDILAFLSQQKSTIITESHTPIIGTKANPSDEIIVMDRMRKMIADRMVHSKQTSPHVTSFVETDMTTVVLWRNSVKDAFQQKHKENITFTPILIRAVVQAIQDFPMINVSVNGDNIIKKIEINIGMAVALPNGNLIVPVIRNANQYNLIGLTKAVNDLSRRAKANKLTADDLVGGTYTVSNIGTFGNIMGTPIILQPQVAIMAFGAIQKKPAVIETPQGDLIGVRHKMFISHSYDHRVVDGSLGGQFVKRVSDYLEKFESEY